MYINAYKVFCMPTRERGYCFKLKFYVFPCMFVHTYIHMHACVYSSYVCTTSVRVAKVGTLLIPW